MLTKADIKLISALAKTKSRQELGLFVCEGHKLIREMLGVFPCKLLVTTPEQFELIQDFTKQLTKPYQIQRTELVDVHFDFKKISTMTSPQPMLALFVLPQVPPSFAAEHDQDLALLLDDVQDPGNVGTIIRTADWFGIRKIYMTQGCADAYAPKVIQATMGALSRVQVYRLQELEALHKHYSGAIYGTFLHGDSLYSCDKPQGRALLVLGNEGNGISADVERMVDRRITIPCLATGSQGAESLNVAIAAAICMSEFRR